MMKFTELMERRMRRKSHVRCGPEEKLEISSKAYLSVLLAKLALDNEDKHNKGFVSEWTYQNVPEKIWSIKEMTNFWSIGSRMKKRLNHMGILGIKDLANWDPLRSQEAIRCNWIVTLLSCEWD